MGLFNNKQTDEQENRTPRNPSNVAMFRLLAVAYVAYLCVQMVKTYTAGGPDAPSLPLLIGGVVLLGGGAVFLAILAYKEWKRTKPVYDAAMADLRAEAEAKRTLEEAAEEDVEVEDEADPYTGENAEDAEDTEDEEAEDAADAKEEA